MKVFDYKPEFNKTVLDNGVRVVTEHHPYTRSTCASVFVTLGTRDEPDHLGGVAHFIEHLVFKGTKTRTALDIARTLESVGGEINAYTTREYTCFHTTSLREHLGLSLDVLSDIACNAQFSEKDYSREQEVVRQEIDMSADQLDEYVFDLSFEKSFEGHGLGRSILGTHDSISDMKPADVREYYESQYAGRNIIIAVAGDVLHSEVVDIVNRYFSKGHLKAKKPDLVAPTIKPYKEYIARSSEQVHYLLTLPSASYTNEFRFEAYLLNALLGGGMTSRLYQKVREEQGWVYSVYSYMSSFIDSGLFSIYAGTSSEYLWDVVEAIQTEVMALKAPGNIKKDEIDFFKRQIKGSILLGSDDIENRMNSIAVNEMVFEQYRPVEQVIEEIDQIKLDSIERYIQQYFDFSKAGVLVLGKAEDAQVRRVLDHSLS